MKLSQVKKLTPAERFLYWITEREAIRLARARGQPPPWTDDPLLQRYRFCNVRRADDKVSCWLWKYWYAGHGHHPMLVPAAALARFFNNPFSLSHIHDQVFGLLYNAGLIKDTLRRLRTLHSDKTIFNPAYMVRGNDGADKIASVIDHFVQPLVDTPLQVDTSSMRRTTLRLATRFGFGSFMAGQVVADLRWAMPGPWEDALTWAPLGPGSRRGLNRLLGRPINFKVSQDRFDGELAGVIDFCREKLPPELTVRLEAIDYQNCLCELDRYLRGLTGDGKPKLRYHPQ